ncbi:MAG: branched-chain amino acid ABC transporter permease [Actinobacteria bacterium]|nr:branched-chain amino acid ABC transporter permease [Actinomycetota bacterium]
MHRVIARVILVMVGLAAALFMGLAPAQAEGPSITAIINGADKSPVAGVTVNVANEEGFAGSAETDAEGQATIEVPSPGKYTATVDVTTLPVGVEIKGGPERSVNVLQGDKKALFPVVPAGEGGDSGGDEGGIFADITLNRVLQLILDGVVLSLVIALGALGLSLIFGTTGLSNFAQGELITLGAFTVLVLNTTLGLNLLIAAPIGIVISAALWGWGQNQVLWKPLRKRGTGLIAAMIVSIGLAIALRYTILFFFGGSPESYAQFAGQPGIDLGPVFITPKAIFLSIIAVVFLAAAVAWLKRSRLGKATRAVSDNPALASASGVNVERVISVVWVLGALLAAYAGVFLGMTQNVVWTMGQFLLLTLFAAVVLGGLGTISGAIVGSFVVGITVQLSTLIVPPELKTASALLLMIVLLLIRPQGLLGRPERVG